MNTTLEERYEKSKLPHKGLLIIASLVKRELLLIIVIFFVSALGSLGNVAYARLFEGLDEALESPDLWTSIYIPLGLIAVTIFRALVGSFGGIVASYMGASIAYQLSNKVYRHIMKVPLQFFDRSSVGEIMSKIGYNVGAVCDAINKGFLVLIREGVTIVILLAYLFYTNWFLTLIIISSLPLVSMLLNVTRKRFAVLSYRLKKLSEEMSRVMVDVFSSLTLVRVSVTEKEEVERYKQYSRYGKRESLKMSAVNAISGPILHTLVAIPFAGVLYIALSGNANSFDDIGKLIAYLTACSFLGAPIRALAGVQATIQKGEVSAYDYIHYLSLKHEEDSGSITLDPKEVKGQIEFRDVTFGYEKDKPVIKNLNLTFAAGQKTALVGLSGSGKSTLINLIMRLYEVREGRILLDGTNTKDIRLKSLRHSISYIGQEVFLFNDTLRHNILYGNDKKCSDEQINKIMASANIKDFIDEMPEGLDTKLGEDGIKLSGGQKQRLSIARALIKDANLVIMDEATSSLDVKNEYEIRHNINALTANRTMIIIAHRLNTIERMDKIVLLGHGEVLGQGTHEELLETNKQYADLCSYQYKD